MSKNIRFFSEEVNFELKNKVALRNWIAKAASNEGYSIKSINYIFCNDDYLHKINVEYLDHDTLTDIITFDNSEDPGRIESDIFISIDTVASNANDLNITFEVELHRVIIHGLLHLCGYKDKSPQDAILMREKENHYLSLQEF
jgi:probable rRNA maturation factor